MFPQYKKLVPGIVILIVLLLLAGCSSANNNSTTNSSTQSSTTTAVSTTPQLITPRSASGSPGKGPLVISSPTMVPGTKQGAQQVVLGDRTLILSRVTIQNGTNSNSSMIVLELAIHNTSSKTIMNLANFFQLMGPDGDAFGYQYNSSDNFYGPITAFQTRTGTIVFEVPKAAISSLQLLYRPEAAAETVIIRLKTS
jgi:Domain of unknown function (DUF4352)